MRSGPPILFDGLPGRHLCEGCIGRREDGMLVPDEKQAPELARTVLRGNVARVFRA